MHLRFFQESRASPTFSSLDAVLSELLPQRRPVNSEPLRGHRPVAAGVLEHGPQERRFDELEEPLVEQGLDRLGAVCSRLRAVHLAMRSVISRTSGVPAGCGA